MDNHGPPGNERTPGLPGGAAAMAACLLDFGRRGPKLSGSDAETSLGAQTSDLERLICFTPGTLIATPRGERLVETLRPGDRVFTRDNGIQEIAWTGSRTLGAPQLAQRASLAPVLICKGALGRGLPARDMLVSPGHRMLRISDESPLYLDQREVLTPARHLVGQPGIVRQRSLGVTYVHFLCSRHELVLADGAWSESLQPARGSIGGLDAAQRLELERLFPDFARDGAATELPPARVTVTPPEARSLRS